MGYEELLERGLGKVPKRAEDKERFEIPRPKTLRQGSKTILINFNEIANALRRDPRHLLKFLLKELATSSEIKDNKLIFQGNFTEEHIAKKIEIYAKTYVYCPECGKPDTNLVKEEGFYQIKCEACGARKTVGKI